MKQFLIVIFLFAASWGRAADIVVDRAGRGDFRNIAEAIDSLRKSPHEREITVFIRDGFYKEKLELTPDINNVRFVGESRDGVVINYDDHAAIDDMRTFKTYTFKISGSDLSFSDLTIENSALPLGQAVALHTEGDRIVFRNCAFRGDQDTIYAGESGSRLLFDGCYIEGTTDFIFGPATACFVDCDIFCKKNSYITAPNTPADQRYGLIFDHCRVTTAEGVDVVYLGRPWRPYGMALFMNCTLGEGIAAAGWDNWRNSENEKTARFMEYGNTGAVADRVAWSSALTAEQAAEYTLAQILGDAYERISYFRHTF